MTGSRALKEISTEVRPQVSPVLIDVALAIVVTAAVALAIAAKVEPEALEPDGWAYLFAVGLGSLMLVRRRWPAGVLIATLVVLAVYYTIGYPAVGVSVPIAGAVYSAAEQGRLRLAIAVSATVFVVAMAYRLGEESAAKLFGFEGAQNLVLLVAVIALGDSIRARRELRLQSWLRAERVRIEHERDARERVEQERLRIAREVHDVLAHSVSAISLQSAVGLEALPAEPENAVAALRNIRQVSTSALVELRNAVGVLRDRVGVHRQDVVPPVGGLADLDRIVATAADGGLQVNVFSVGSDARTAAPLPLVVDAAAHRIVQESITNVLRHSASVAAAVEIDYRTTEIRLRISNTATGRGAESIPLGGPSPVTDHRPANSQISAIGSGFGLVGMRERAELLGGTLTAVPTSAGGFEVSAVLPFPVPSVHSM